MADNPQRRGPSNPRGNAPGRNGGEPDSEQLLIPDRIVTYFEETVKPGQRPVLRAQLLDDEASSVAKEIKTLPASQLRRFYASVLSLKRELEVNPAGATDGLVLARLALLKAHAAYAKKRMKGVPDAFIKFIVRHVASVKTRDDFLYGFAPCFEAVVAYHKFFETSEKG